MQRTIYHDYAAEICIIHLLESVLDAVSFVRLVGMSGGNPPNSVAARVHYSMLEEAGFAAPVRDTWP